MGYLRLVNLPLVFTALGDVVAGYVVVTSLGGEAPSFWKALMLVVASACLFAAGSASRACFEFEEGDESAAAGEIASGQVSLKIAFLMVSALAVTGMLCAMLVAKTAVYFAWALLFVHWLHGGYLRNMDVTGAVAVGATRLLNLLMGMGAVAELLYARNSENLVLPAAILVVYAVIIAIMGRLKAEGGTRFTLLASGGGIGVTLIAAMAFYWQRSLFSVVLILMVAGAVAAPMLLAVMRLSPKSIGRVVAVGLIAAVLLDAAFIFGAHSPSLPHLYAKIAAGVMTMLLVVPATASWWMIGPKDLEDRVYAR